MKKNFASLACVSIFALSACGKSDVEKNLEICKSEANNIVEIEKTLKYGADHQKTYDTAFNNCVQRLSKK